MRTRLVGGYLLTTGYLHFIGKIIFINIKYNV